jgi:hypothetical protein
MVVERREVGSETDGYEAAPPDNGAELRTSVV